MTSPISALVDLLDGLFQRLVVAAHQAAGDLEVLLRGLLAGLEHAADARGVDGERFLHEDVAALGHGVFQVDRPEARRRGQEHHVARVRARRWPSCRRPGRRTGGPAARRPAWRTASAKCLRLPSRRSWKKSAMAQSFVGPLVLQGLGGGPGAAPAAADQGDLDRVVLAGIGAGRQQPPASAAPASGAAGPLEELATRRHLAANSTLSHSKPFRSERGNNRGRPYCGRGPGRRQSARV